MKLLISREMNSVGWASANADLFLFKTIYNPRWMANPHRQMIAPAIACTYL